MNRPICYFHIGQRPNHEDNFFLNGLYLTPDSQKQMPQKRSGSICDTTRTDVRLFAVSDGMGGHNAGEVASRICVEELASAYSMLQRTASLQEAVTFLQEVIAQINEKVCEMSHRRTDLKGMGATLVLMVTYGTELAVLNIGDSRAYPFTDDVMTQITKDHTEGQRMLDLGLLTRKELSTFPARKNLSRYIGYGQSGYVLQADEYYPNRKDGIVLLCSDGISDFVPDVRIAEILRAEKNLELVGKQLINEAISSQYADNATVILVPLEE